MSYETLDVTVAAGVARIAFNRPDKLNALTRVMLHELGSALDAAAENDDVRVISLTGRGRAFCAGQDLSERDPRKLGGPLDLAAIQRELFHPIVRKLRETPKPVVACVTALAADIVLASTDAKFALSFAKVGLSVDAGLGRALAQGLGPARARAALMLGETLTAKQAAEAGLIWAAVPDPELDAAHETLLERLTHTPRTALSGIKTAIAAAHLPLNAYLEIEAAAQGRAGAHPDYSEGVLAFLERRPARFS